MDIDLAASMARELMDMHGLAHVPFGFNRRYTAFGVTRFGKKLICEKIDSYGRTRRRYGPWYLKCIELSRPLVELNPVESVRDTILHEIAHAMAGNAAGHGVLWQVAAMQIGANPQACCGSDVTVVSGKYQAVCHCGLTHNFYRMPKTRKMCKHCRMLLMITKVR